MQYSTTLTGMDRNLASAQVRAELDVALVGPWLKALRRQGLGLALPAMMLKLDTLAKADVHPIQRVELLRLFKRPVLKAMASLPKPVVASSDFAKSAGSGVTLEQRLLGLMQSNYRQVLRDLAKFEYADDPDYDAARSWATRNLFHFIERQIRYGIDWQVPWPAGTWQDLHDLYVFLSLRGPARILAPTELDAADPEREGEEDLDPAVAYKRLLLLGLASQIKPTSADDQMIFEKLDAWALESRLDEPERRVWDQGVYLVEVAKDAPPRFRPGVLEDSFHGWVLEPAQGFLVYVGRALAPEVPGFHPFELQRASGQN